MIMCYPTYLQYRNQTIVNRIKPAKSIYVYQKLKDHKDPYRILLN